ncbi:hypothetical protein GCM10007860_23460 [Chitiniphilus shinanonensis]|uniref:Uncharacterized protein n=1 Tax=Chitiniphilus shinanonensis TaxID=553088 RepID=A0ABQ6BTU7_9NEIS|nr:hypothetical protein [Chitiniphilus shinanonensis]GLS05196.1 hypothetical protein GCM10007860_23460 [Chitiniphilus shinanonensis]
MPLRLLTALILCLPAWSLAAVLVTAVEGDARREGQPLAAFATLEPGQAGQLPAGASIRLADTERARQGRWEGPATLRIDAGGIRAEGRQTERNALPGAIRAALLRAPANLAKVAELDDDLPSRLISARLTQARQQYQRWRTQFAADDVAPELYLLDVQLAARDGLGIQATLAEMARRQPHNTQLARLSAHMVSLNLAMSPGDPGAQLEVKPLLTP